MNEKLGNNLHLDQPEAISSKRNSRRLRVVPEGEWAGSAGDPDLAGYDYDEIKKLMESDHDISPAELNRADVHSVRTHDLGDAPGEATQSHPVK